MVEYHIVPTKNGQWALKRVDSVRAVKVFQTQQEALDYAQRMSEPRTVKVHGKDGRIREERTYPRSADPCPPRG